MKKILLTSSALVLVGGSAFAEVTLSGSAEMGVVGGSVEGSTVVAGEATSARALPSAATNEDGDPLFVDSDGVVSTDTSGTPLFEIPEDFVVAPATREIIDVDADTDLQFWSDMDVTFTLSGESGNGVSFGASIDLDDVADGTGINATDDSDFAVFVSGDWGTVTLGDTDGAFDWAMQDTNFGMPGTINDNEEHLGFDGMNILDGFYDGQIARYEYSFGDFAFALSAEVDDEPDDEAAEGATDFDNPMFGIGGKYSLDLDTSSWTIGAAWQGTEDIYVAGISASGTFGGGFSGSLAYYAGEVAGVSIGLNDDGTNIEFDTNSSVATSDELTDINYFGGSLGYSWDAFAVGINGGQYDFDNADQVWGWGITGSYDLGGGLELQAGYGYSKAKGQDELSGVELEADTYSLGLSMSF